MVDSKREPDYRRPEIIGISGECARDFEKHVLQEGFDRFCGPPGVITPYIHRDGPCSFGFPEGIFEGRGSGQGG